MKAYSFKFKDAEGVSGSMEITADSFDEAQAYFRACFNQDLTLTEIKELVKPPSHPNKGASQSENARVDALARKAR